MSTLKKSFAAVLVLVMVFALTACGGGGNTTAPAASEQPQTSSAPPAQPSPAEVIELRWSIAWPVGNMVNQQLGPWFAEEINKRTDGRVRITIFNGGELLDVPGTYEGVVNGIADMGTSRIGSTPGRFPIMLAFEMPGFQFNNTYAANYTYREIYDKYTPPDMQDTKVLWIDSGSPAVLYTKMPIHKLEDIQGRQIRADGLVAEAMLALGATPVSFSINDAYIALQNNVADGILDSFRGLTENKLGEVTDYIILIRGVSPGPAFFNVMNLDKWNSLPPDIQQIFIEVSKEAVDVSTKMFWDFEDRGVQFGYDEGMQVSLLDAGEDARWIGAINDVSQNWIDAGDGSFDRAGMMADFDAAIAKYNAQFPDKWPAMLFELFPEAKVG